MVGVCCSRRNAPGNWATTCCESKNGPRRDRFNWADLLTSWGAASQALGLSPFAVGIFQPALLGINTGEVYMGIGRRELKLRRYLQVHLSAIQVSRDFQEPAQNQMGGVIVGSELEDCLALPDGFRHAAGSRISRLQQKMDLLNV